MLKRRYVKRRDTIPSPSSQFPTGRIKMGMTASFSLSYLFLIPCSAILSLFFFFSSFFIFPLFFFFFSLPGALVEESQDFATSVVRTGLFVVHDPKGSGEHHVAELTRGKDVLHPLLILLGIAVKAGANSATLIEVPIEVDHNLPSAVVVNKLKGTNVVVLLHHLQEFHHYLRDRAEQHLAFTAALGARDSAKGISQNAHHGHDSNAQGEEEK